MPEKQKSPHWDERQHITSKVRPKEKEFFNEGWPRGCDVATKFTIITWDGEKLTAIVDYSRQYASDGLNWQTLSGKCFDRHQVIAWREN